MMHSEKVAMEFGAKDAQNPAAQTRILVIEDDPQIQKILQRTFREQGYEVTVCGNGQDGLDTFRSSRQSAVILDLVLPAIFGRDLCKMFKAEQPGVPVIVLSAIS